MSRGSAGRHPEDITWLEQLREAFPGATVTFRPLGSPPEGLPEPHRPLTEREQKARKKWLVRETARYGLVNYELPREPLPLVQRWFEDLGSQRRLERRERQRRKAEHVLACAHCGVQVEIEDLTNFRRSDGRWVHLLCQVAASPEPSMAAAA
jgi:hypothetical protein